MVYTQALCRRFLSVRTCKDTDIEPHGLLPTRNETPNAARHFFSFLLLPQDTLPTSVQARELDRETAVVFPHHVVAMTVAVMSKLGRHKSPRTPRLLSPAA